VCFGELNDKTIKGLMYLSKFVSRFILKFIINYWSIYLCINIICLTLEKTNTWMILYAHWLMSSNKWTYILGIFCEDEIRVSKESGGLTKIKRGSFKKKLVILSN
jgi:hypothetical protein